MARKYSPCSQADGIVSAKPHNNEYRSEGMTDNTSRGNTLSDRGDYFHDTVISGRKWRTLYIAMDDSIHTLLYNYDYNSIRAVKSSFITILHNRGLISHYQYECILFYAGREILNEETLQSCHIGDKATINAILREDGSRESRKSKSVKSSLDLLDSDEDVEQSVAKKQKTVSFADDLISYPPLSFQQPFTSQTSSMMLGGLGPGELPLRDFHDPLVRDCPPKHDLPGKHSLDELSRNTSFASQPLPYDILPLASRNPGYDFFGNPMVQREDTRRNWNKDANDILPKNIEYSSSPTAAHLNPQSSILQPPTFDLLPAVRNTVYLGPSGTSGTKPKSGPLPFSSILGLPNPSYTITPPPRTHTISPFTQQAPLFSSKDLAVSYSSSPSSSSPISGLPINKYLPNRLPPSTTPRTILKPSPTSSPANLQSSPIFPSQNTQFSLPSSSQPPEISTLRSLNSYFSKTVPPPSNHFPSQKILPPTSSNSPQSAKQNPMNFDYFKAARSKSRPSESKNHPLNSPLPPPPPPPHLRVKPSPSSSLEHSKDSYRLPSVGWSDKLQLTVPYDGREHSQSESPSSSHPETNLPSKAPDRQLSQPPTSTLHSPPSFKKPRQAYELSRLPLFYIYDLLPPESSTPTPKPTPTPPVPTITPESSFPTPKPTPKSPIPLISPASSKPIKIAPPEPLTKPTTSKSTIYHSSQYPLPRGFSFKGAVVIPILAHEILPKELLGYRAVRQLVENQGWETSAEQWRAIKRVLEREEEAEREEGRKVDNNRGVRGNLEVLMRRLMAEVEEMAKERNLES
ncbi:hypothetical protein EYC80_002853 [Monilinia laxa]|uniref:Ubiquitin-like domain-containing protein n=1 Tax=Monilinia laxa TaxID=61186 RepID=A0A5N6KBY9_MONLA|nr:hypothetical protein EYC80_002853 [Monilinia laxa]